MMYICVFMCACSSKLVFLKRRHMCANEREVCISVSGENKELLAVFHVQTVYMYEINTNLTKCAVLLYMFVNNC